MRFTDRQRRRLGTSGRLRVWPATLADPNTGNIAVGVKYKDLSTYASEQGKIAGDKEWQKLLSGLEAIRTVESRSLYGEITPWLGALGRDARFRSR